MLIQKKQADRLHINIHQAADQAPDIPLGVPEGELRIAVEKVGDSAIAVRKQLGIERSDDDES
ncbi:DUF3606 domain-containing protein [Bradyrhizobium sp. B124]|uniref:DUF3606 domain-containing protein n=1 Tax=Bradyrhizobium sp. B124 TaxID=3140245 RepID=UPI0031843A87